jgi:uncharacterized protein YdaU (DUF1376 family)
MANKMVFINYCPDDQLSGCMVLSYKAELCYRRLQDLIYTNDDNLFNDEVTWEQSCRGFLEDKDKIKQELINKRKISIENDQIKNKRCSEEIEQAKERYLKAKKGAEARWGVKSDTLGKDQAYASHNASHMPTTNYKLQTTNYKLKNNNIYTQEFDTFWRKYVLDEGDRRSTKWDTFQQWKKLDDTTKKSLGDRFLTYRNQKGDFYKALERFISKKIYLDVEAEKIPTKEDFEQWQFKNDVEMRKKGLKTMRWSVDYIEKLDKFIENEIGS